MKRDKMKFIIFGIIYIVVLSIVLFALNINSLKENELITQNQKSDAFTWEFDFYELTEEQQKQFKELGEQGFSFSERIEIVLPEEYEKLKENKLVNEMMEIEKGYEQISQ